MAKYRIIKETYSILVYFYPQKTRDRWLDRILYGRWEWLDYNGQEIDDRYICLTREKALDTINSNINRQATKREIEYLKLGRNGKAS